MKFEIEEKLNKIQSFDENITVIGNNLHQKDDIIHKLEMVK